MSDPQSVETPAPGHPAPDPAAATFLAETFDGQQPGGRLPRPRGRLREHPVSHPPQPAEGAPVGTNPAYVRWLVEQSMLEDARRIGSQFSAVGAMWQNPYADPDPRAAITAASVWFTAYPTAMAPGPGRSFLAALGDDRLWQHFQQIGIEAVHTGPVKQAGGISGWQHTPTVDGHFDRSGTHLDPAFGDEDEFRRMCEVAAAHGGTIIDDIVPGHTGKGADFRLAEMKVGDYPGIFHMVEIPEPDWHLLPPVPAGQDAVNLDEETESRLEKAGHIVGPLQRVIFHEPGVKDTNWSATDTVVGPDGVARRWVYLHYFKQGQPSINWLDPTFAGIRMVVGDALHSLADLGAGALRFDANGFLGVEKRAGGSAWSEGHPLSEGANQFLAAMVRKLGAFSFQELNLTVDDIRQMSLTGADLSYDFVNRPAYQHALATGDTEFLRLTLRTVHEFGIDPASLIHALQNHDELTYELVHFASRHAQDRYRFRGREVTGAELATTVRADLVERLTGPNAPYNLIFTTNGISSTAATVVAASLGITDLATIGPEDTARIRRGHLLLAMFNAWQPGVFALSGWDLCGALTLAPAELGDRLADLLGDGDTRWIHRGGYDLMGTGGGAGMPPARSLYGTLPEQLADPESFASRLAAILAMRKRYGIATAEQVDVPEVPRPGLLVMVHRLPAGSAAPGAIQATVLNFGTEPVTARVGSEHFRPRAGVRDLLTGDVLGAVEDDRTITVSLDVHQGRALILDL